MGAVLVVLLGELGFFAKFSGAHCVQGEPIVKKICWLCSPLHETWV